MVSNLKVSDNAAGDSATTGLKPHKFRPNCCCVFRSIAASDDTRKTTGGITTDDLKKVYAKSFGSFQSVAIFSIFCRTILTFPSAHVENKLVVTICEYIREMINK